MVESFLLCCAHSKLSYIIYLCSYGPSWQGDLLSKLHNNDVIGQFPLSAGACDSCMHKKKKMGFGINHHEAFVGSSHYSSCIHTSRSWTGASGKHNVVTKDGIVPVSKIQRLAPNSPMLFSKASTSVCYRSPLTGLQQAP